ncbi:ComF family protein [Bifidobacterium aesculapii]|uniref:ComF family protein n=1 Tax=Bifidobacterium aesculapii TaxID=1329411 RepID=UPI0006E1CAC3|nr:phosphoribosyltransferase family protein [Bifidobacterium aesculapii]
MMRGLVADMTNLILPRGCAGCDAPDEVLCPSCAALFACVVPFTPPADGIASYACSVYKGATRRVILAWKDHADAECDRALSGAMRVLASQVTRTVTGGAMMVVVPAPSSARSARRRGRRHLMPVARSLAAWYRSMGVRARAVDALSVHAAGKAVETMGRAGRVARVTGSHINVRDAASVRGCDVILIDDIVTTGATMRACVTSLEAAGGRVAACLALASTPKYAVSAA